MLLRSTISFGIRLGAILIDSFVMGLIIMLCFLPAMQANSFGLFSISHEPIIIQLFKDPSVYVALLGLALYFCKDCFNGQSIGKRLTRIQVIDNKRGVAASSLQCLVRNLFCILAPIEALVLLNNVKRRLGDMVAGTTIASYDATVNPPRINIVKSIFSLLLAYVLLLIALLPLHTVTVSSSTIKFVQSSYNEAESKKFTQLYAADSISRFLSADVRIYDSIENRKIKYISVIFKLKQDYFNYTGVIDQLEKESAQIINSQYPQYSFTGQEQYVYYENDQGHTEMHNSSRQIGLIIINSKDQENTDSN